MSEHASILSQKQGIPATVAELKPIPEQDTYSDSLLRLPIQRQLSVGAVDDPLEDEADAMADKVMRMPEESFIQRKCAHCEEEEKAQRKPLASFIQRKQTDSSNIASNRITNQINSTKGSGSAMNATTKSFMESRFGADFSNVRIHADNNSVQLSNKLNAQAFTVGNSIYFNEGQYNPNNDKGKHLLAHELAHTVQHKSNAEPFISRKTYKGEDHNGRYTLDDQQCTLLYEQDWYFRFDSKFPAARHVPYMQAAETQVENVWSHKHKLKPSGTNCLCHENGIDVSMDLHTKEGRRGKKKGYGVKVTPTEQAGRTWPDDNMILGEVHETPYWINTTSQQRIAHEFGHTLGLIDEYDKWADFFGIEGHNDINSIMHSGDVVHQRHYQHFADIVNLEIGACTYQPEGILTSSFVTPVAQFGVTGALRLDNAQFILGLHADRRLGNNALMGMYYPYAGFDAYINTSTGSVKAGPSIGASLNRWYHPIYLNVSTGVLFDPGTPDRKPTLDIPASVTLGFRGSGYNAGLNYTGMYDVLGNAGYTHLIGVNLQFDL